MLSAEAALTPINNQQVSRTAFGVVISGNESRLSSDQMNIVNDQEANNTDAGVIAYDISFLQGYNVSSASLSYVIDSWSADTQTAGIQYYWSTNSSACSRYVTSGGTQTYGVGTSVGAGTTGRDALLEELGSSTANLIGTVSKGTQSGNFNGNSLVSALNSAVTSGASTFYVIIVHEKAGGKGSGNGWSDTKVTASKQNLSIQSAAEIQHIRSEITDSIRPSATAVGRGAFKGTADRAADSS